MNMLTFWLSVLGFTSLFGTFILSYIAQKERFEEFRAQYLWYVAISWFWFVLQFIGFVHNTFLDRTNLLLLTFIAIMRAIISVLLIFRIVTLLGCIEQGIVTKQFRKIGFVAATLICILLIPIMFLNITFLGPLFTTLVNAAIGVTFLMFRVRNSGQSNYRIQRMQSFMSISAVAYLLFGLYALLFTIFTSSYRPVYDSLATAIFILIWCVNDVLIYLRQPAGSVAVDKTDSLMQFGETFSLTIREMEIVTHLVKGLSYKEIADVLCISPRTVETHVYRIFKKCSVSNKIGLTNKIGIIRTNT